MTATDPVGPSRTGPWCFVLLTARPFTADPFNPVRAHGGLFMSADPARAGSLLRLAAARADFTGAFQAVVSAGWAPCTLPFTAVRVTGLAAVTRPGDPWAAVVYTAPPVRDHRRVRFRTPAHAATPPPVVYYGVAPLGDPEGSMPVAEAAARSEYFFRQLIIGWNLG